LKKLFFAPIYIIYFLLFILLPLVVLTSFGSFLFTEAKNDKEFQAKIIAHFDKLPGIFQTLLSELNIGIVIIYGVLPFSLFGFLIIQGFRKKKKSRELT
jgi:hypothetical protein